MARRESPCGDAAIDRAVIPMSASPGAGVTAGYRRPDRRGPKVVAEEGLEPPTHGL